MIGHGADSAFWLAGNSTVLSVWCKLNLIFFNDFDYKNGYFLKNIISYWQPKFMTKISL